MPDPARQNPVFRFAPSPNGRLHLGHALSALLNRDMAADAGGCFLLRIEDIDLARCTPDLEAGIYEDLTWLGLAWEQPVRRQSAHFGDYRNALLRLEALGLVYPAFLTRGEVQALVTEQEKSGRRWPRDPDGSPLYPDDDKRRTAAERQRLLSSARKHAWRLDMTRALALAGGGLHWQETADGACATIQADPAAWGDVVLSRSDAPSSYHLSVVVDDGLQGVTHVVRGRDLFDATAIHVLLQKLLGLARPVYHHHRLITDAAGRKLSKSSGDIGLAHLRAKGLSPADIRHLVGL